MARGRMISKEISLDEKVDALSDDTARLLFTWMIPHLDVEGRMYGEAQTFKSIVVPRRNISALKVEKYLKEMEKLELIFRYNVNGNQYIFKPNFEKHQTGLQKNREAQSRIPPNITRVSPELIKSNSNNSHSEVKVKVKDKEYTLDGFNIFWSAYPRKEAKLKAEQAFKKINPDEKLLAMMLDMLERFKKTKQWQDRQLIPHPATWLNAKRWEDELDKQKTTRNSWS